MFDLDFYWMEIYVGYKLLLITSYFLVYMQKKPKTTFIECLLFGWHCPRHFPRCSILTLTTAL